MDLLKSVFINDDSNPVVAHPLEAVLNSYRLSVSKKNNVVIIKIKISDPSFYASSFHVFQLSGPV